MPGHTYSFCVSSVHRTFLSHNSECFLGATIAPFVHALHYSDRQQAQVGLKQGSSSLNQAQTLIHTPQHNASTAPLAADLQVVQIHWGKVLYQVDVSRTYLTHNLYVLNSS